MCQKDTAYWPPCREIQPEAPLSLLQPPLHHQQTSPAVMVGARLACILSSLFTEDYLKRVAEKRLKQKDVTSLHVEYVIRRCLHINFILNLTIRVLQLSLH